MKSELNKLEIEQREKNIKKTEITALMMLAVGVIVLIASIVMCINLGKTYSILVNSPYYKGLSDREKENDILEDSFKLMTEVENIFESVYILDMEREEIDENLVSALMKAYGDEYAVYRDPEETYVSTNSMEQRLEGIGIYMTAEYEDSVDEFKLYMIDVYKDSPAEKAGIEIGDFIIKVNGKSFSKTKFDYSDIVKEMRDAAGTTVDITFTDSSDGNKEKTVTITRDHVEFTRTVVHSKVADDVALIKIREFDSKTTEEFIDATKYYLDNGINKFIFDLRSNPGGIKTEAIEALDYLLPSGLILKELDKNGDILEEHYSDEDHIDFKSVCLVNEGTASAAECFTQALRDYELTTVIGETTLGKGTVCTLFPLSNGGSVFISTSKYFTKSGVDIENNGIVPDIEFRLDEKKEKISYRLSVEEDDLIQLAIENLK